MRKYSEYIPSLYQADVFILTANTRRWHNVGLCWAGVEDDGPTLTQHWANALCLLGYLCLTVSDTMLM